MIKKACFITFFLLVSYAVFVGAMAPKWWHVTQTQWQANVVKAEKFIYNEKDSFANVIVGSSLSSRLIMDSLPNTYNLSFDGLGIYDGLEILSKKKNLPKNVFIEMNVAFRRIDHDFISGLFSPIQYYSKKNVIALRDDEQPIGIIGDQIYWRITNHVIDRLKGMIPVSGENKIGNPKNELFEKMLDMQIVNYSKTPDKKIVSDCFKKLHEYVIGLQKKGVNVMFFEMPVNNRLINLPQAVLIRSDFYAEFPNQKYGYVQLPDSVDYKTSDGLHLNEEEAKKYTSYFKVKMENYLTQK